MATDSENLSTITTSNTNDNTEDNPTKTLDAVNPTSVEPDQVKDSNNAVDSTTEESKDSEDSKSKTAVSPVSVVAPVSDTDKKIRRAERFGITVQLSEQEKRNSRAER